MSVTVFLVSGETISIQSAHQWHYTRATLELGDERGESVGSFLVEQVTGCVTNGHPHQTEPSGAYRDKTGDHFGLGAPEEEEEG